MLKAASIAVKDRLRYTRSTWSALTLAKTLRASFTGALPQRLDRLADAYRASLLADHPKWVEEKLRPYVEDRLQADIWRRERIGWERIAPRGLKPYVNKGIVLKAPRPNGERGVLLLSFEYNWLPVLVANDAERLWRDYTILCSTAWSPPPIQALGAFAQLPGADVYFLPSNRRDVEWFQRLKTGARVLPLYMSHWINPMDYQPVPSAKRSIDILMVANWATFKRHWVLFKALKQLPPTLKVVLVGQPEAGRTLEHVRQEAALFGVADRIEFRERLGMDEVTRLQCDSKVALVFSKREGSCVVVAEALMADTPVGLVKDAHIGSADFINDRTGVFLNEDNLAGELAAFVARHHQFTPRQWAMENISCHVSTARMNEHLRADAAKDGRPWTQDTCVLGWRPNPGYVTPGDAETFAPVYQELKQRHGLAFLVGGI